MFESVHLSVKDRAAALNAAINAKFSPGEKQSYVLPRQDLPYIALDERSFARAGINEQEAEDAALAAVTELAASRNPYRVRALEALAKHYEHRERNYAMALEMTRTARELEDTPAIRRRELRLKLRLDRPRNLELSAVGARGAAASSQLPPSLTRDGAHGADSGLLRSWNQDELTSDRAKGTLLAADERR